jgi:putative protease
MRYFNGRPVELLAPAGNFLIFKEIAGAKCDAVYFGGKRFNMRLHRRDFNFSNEELRAAVDLAHEKGKRAYITVNNMYVQDELDELEEYLRYLEEIKPDAILVQDFAVPRLVRRLGLSLAMHASVMMNVHNLETIKALEAMGFSRVVVSRELPLSYIRAIAAETNMEAEYFVHGDMCVAHGGQCLYSGMIFGSSSNQGRCLKPCRWDYEIECGAARYAPSFPLAVKDMYLYEHIPELIHNRVSSFKIEGRMREADYLVPLVNAYGDAIDRYIEDPLAYDRFKDAELLYRNRKRDFSTAYAFGKPGLANINRRMEGTGAFYSTGKVFSRAVEEPELDAEKQDAINKRIALFLDSRKARREAGSPSREAAGERAAAAGRQDAAGEQSAVVEQSAGRRGGRGLELSAKVQTMAQARYCVEQGVDHVYLSGDVFLPGKPFSRGEIQELLSAKAASAIWLCQGRMMFDQELEEFVVSIAKLEGLDGIVVSSLGGLAAARNAVGVRALRFRGAYGLNIQNSLAWEWYRDQGLEAFTISAETGLDHTLRLLESSGAHAELIVFGSPTVMYLEHDLFENTKGEAETLYLIDEKGSRHPVYKDRRGRNHVLLVKNLSFLPFIGELSKAGLTRIRVEASHITGKEYEKIIDTALKIRDSPEEAPGAVNLGPYHFGVGPWGVVKNPVEVEERA